MKIAILFSDSSTSQLSYNDDWLDGFLNISDQNIQVKAFDSLRLSPVKAQKILYEFDFIVLLHSTNSNAFNLPKLYRLGSMRYRQAKVIIFMGNEYKLIPEKISLVRANNIDYIVSQLPQETAEWLYFETGASIISLPHALNSTVFSKIIPLHNRHIDIGNRSYEYPWYLGDVDRIKTLQFTSNLAHNFVIDVSTDPTKRFNRSEWANFLNNCNFTIASEAGSSFLERDDKTRLAVNKFLEHHPTSTFEKVYEKFFKNYTGNATNGKCISSRHFDAIGTHTCQILLEGRYNDILRPNEHYIELKKDFSNIQDVTEKMTDLDFRKSITKNAYEYAMESHTHKHRIDFLLKKIMN